MNILSVFLVGIGLSMDNFAVSLAAGTIRPVPKLPVIFRMSALFTLAHFVMFSGGWLLGNGIGPWIHTLDHWLAFAILCFIGVHMMKEAREHHKPISTETLRSLKMCLFLAAATSVDAWMVGMGISLARAPFWLPASVMAGCVFLTSYGGFKMGAWMGKKLGPVAEITGGVLLILIGVKLLLEGLGIW